MYFSVKFPFFLFFHMFKTKYEYSNKKNRIKIYFYFFIIERARENLRLLARRSEWSKDLLTQEMRSSCPITYKLIYGM